MIFVTVIRAFAFVLFLFVPSIAVMLFAGFVLKSAWWFVALGLPVLLVNGAVCLIQPVRGFIGLRLKQMA